ncbi:MAG: hypothetical protein FWE82_09860 [Defluviitaleaceae bacterium]|nr:hypothetical protein [Defluviitaleaceae bacterium]
MKKISSGEQCEKTDATTSSNCGVSMAIESNKISSVVVFNALHIRTKAGKDTFAFPHSIPLQCWDDIFAFSATYSCV